MEPHDPDHRRALAHRLAGSALWRTVLDEVFLPDYASISRALDTTKDDHRYYQGFKEALRLLIEWPYHAIGEPSPLALPHVPRRQRRAKDEGQEQVPEPHILRRRQGVLA